MKFGYTIVYVSDVKQSLKFFQAAFGIETKFLHESGDYGELNTGETTLAFASIELGKTNFGSFSALSDLKDPVGVEIALVTDNVPESYQNAINAGAIAFKAPESKPWGQTVAYVKSPHNLIVELCTPVGL